MSWLEKLLPPKILHTDPADRRSVPEGLWIKCPQCESVLYKTDLEQNQNVAPLAVTTTALARVPVLTTFWTTKDATKLAKKWCPSML